MTSLVQFVVSVAVLGAGTAYLAHYVREDDHTAKKPQQKTFNVPASNGA